MRPDREGSQQLASRTFWSDNPPGVKWLTGRESRSLDSESYEAIRSTRYGLEPHLEELAEFCGHKAETVVEIGCGVGTDGSRFLEGGANYVGIDASYVSVQTALDVFRMLDLPGKLTCGDATALPMRSESADFVYSNGVLHHVPDIIGAVREIHRVLRPGGRCVVMLYHGSSFNYRVNILLVRRLGALLLPLPEATQLVSRVTGEDPAVLAGHKELLKHHGLRYLTDTGLFLSNNTDGPGNPLSKVFSRKQVGALFSDFTQVRTEVRFLNLRLLPGLDRLLGKRLKERLERRWGWHLYVVATR
jgi:SAM-dependent methyltransferase